MQCVNPTTAPGKKPRLCGSCRDPKSRNAVIGVRIVYLSLVVFVVYVISFYIILVSIIIVIHRFGLVVAAVGAILLNDGVKTFFSNSTNTLDWLINTTGKLDCVLDGLFFSIFLFFYFPFILIMTIFSLQSVNHFLLFFFSCPFTYHHFSSTCISLVCISECLTRIITPFIQWAVLSSI